ncbi:MAG: hypothetical protein EA397_16215 [Deltaproteobacteria bacterium]|nr:MAG: hypothetical protein EA397_16215 [Deltaproteobacteria bacterium]
MSDLRHWLDRFDAVRRHGPFDYDHHHHHDGGDHDLHVVVGCMIHGDEVGSLPAVVELIESLCREERRFSGQLTLFVGNPEAGLAGRRFLEADLNRVFVEEPPDNHEGRRARALMPILNAASIFLDLHQTILETDRPFYIFPWSVAGWQWARAIGAASTWVTRAPAQSFSPGTCCADEFVRLRGRPGLTLELSQKGFSHDAHQRAALALNRLLTLADRLGGGTETLPGAATHHPDLHFVETRWRQPFQPNTLMLRPGLANFTPVELGERISAEGSPLIRAPASGMLLFPKYGDYHPDGTAIEPRPGEIVRIVAPLAQHPTELWGE